MGIVHVPVEIAEGIFTVGREGVWHSRNGIRTTVGGKAKVHQPESGVDAVVGIKIIPGAGRAENTMACNTTGAFGRCRGIDAVVMDLLLKVGRAGLRPA